MKRILLSLMAVTLLMTAPLMASSSLEGGDRQKQKEVSAPTGQPMHGESAQPASMEAMTTTPSVKENPTEAASVSLEETVAPTEERVIEKSTRKYKPMKVLREAKQHDGGSGVLGILALVFGIVGFIIAWLFFPIGLLMAIAAIVLGAIGMSGGRPGKGMAIVGLVMGILTILIPVLIVALILALIL